MVVGFLVLSCLVSGGCFLTNVVVFIEIYVNLKGKRQKERMDKDRIVL